MNREQRRRIKKWFSALPDKMAEAVSSTRNSMTEAKIGAGSGYEGSISHNRRMKMKDGTAWNDWLRPPEVGIFKIGCYTWELWINRLRCHTCHDNHSESQYPLDFRL